MKYYTLLLAVAIYSVMPGHAQESPDTVAHFQNISSVTVCRNSNGVSITAKGQPYEPRFTYSYEMEYSPADSVSQADVTFDFSSILGLFSNKNKKVKQRKMYVPSDGLYIGAAIPVGSTPVRASVEVGLTSVLDGEIRCGNVTLLTSAGIGYSQWALDGSMSLATERGKLLITAPGDADTAPYTSRIRTWRVHVPVMLYLSLGSRGYIGGGTWLNFNFATSAYTSRYAGNTTTRNTFKGLHARALTPDIVVTGGIKYVGLYFRYSPKSLFTKDFGPEFKTISLGLITTF